MCFALEKKSRVTFRIYDVLGRLIATVIDKEMDTGEYRVPFNARGLASGVYFYRIRASDADFGVSGTEGAFPINQDVKLELSSSIPSGQYSFPITVHGLFEITSAGTYTFHLLALENPGFFEIYDMQLTLLFIPTEYGTVVPKPASDAVITDDQSPEKSALSDADLTAERNNSIAFNRDRIEREIARMEEELRALKQAVSRDNYVRVKMKR